MISLHEASYTYPNGGVVALDSMSVEVGEGEIVGVMGQNGSGKTTFTKLLNGLLRPTSGSVFINGRDTSRYSVQALAPHVGYVFQNPNHQVFANTVAEELAFGPLNIGHTPEEVAERVAEAAEFFELGAIMRSTPTVSASRCGNSSVSPRSIRCARRCLFLTSQQLAKTTKLA